MSALFAFKLLMVNLATPVTTTSQTPPAATITPPTPPMPQKLNLVSDPRKEYVSGGFYSWLAAYYRALPIYIDDVTAEFGFDLYDRMLLDSAVASAFNVIRLSALARGITLANPVGDENDPDYEQAQEIKEFCERNIASLPTPFEETCFDLLGGMAYGYKVAEQIYEIRKDGPDKGKMCLKAIKVKPQRTVAFVVDVFQNVIGLLGLLPGQGGATVLTTGLIGIPSQSADGANAYYSPINLLPRDKFIIFTFRSKDSDPRGTSLLRAAYTPWWAKQMSHPEYIKYLAQFAGPSLIGYTPEGATEMALTDADGNPILDSSGNPQYITPEQIMLNTLVSFKNGTAVAFPHGAEVNPLNMSGDGSAFLNGIRFFNEEITKAILYQTLATGEGLHQARAASQTHQDILSMVVSEAKTTLSSVLRIDMLRPLVAYNYGKDAAEKFLPLVGLTDTPQEDFSETANAVAELWKAGYLHSSQLVDLDQRLGLPERDLQAQQEDEQLDQAMRLKLAQTTNPQQQQPNDAQPPEQPTSDEKATPKQEGVKPDGMKNSNSKKQDKSEFSDYSDSVMIAFFLPVKEAKKLVKATSKELGSKSDTVLQASELHVTLAYLGNVSELGVTKDEVSHALKVFAATQKPVGAKINGLDRFDTTEDNDTNAVYASYDAPQVKEFRATLVKVLDAAKIPYSKKFPSFTPHTTLAYLPVEEETPDLTIPEMDLNFENFYLAWGDELILFEL